MYVTHSSLNGIEPAEDTKESGADPMAKLMGDWSWRPEMQPVDPGYVYDAQDIQAVQFSIAVREEHGLKSNAMVLAPRRPWLVASYDYHDLVRKPVRIGPCI